MISAIVLAKNEEEIIKKCLNSLSWCDEVIVVDDYSVDNTAKIARMLGARVIRRKLDRDFSAQRNFGLKNAKGDWVLFVDADEEVSGELSNEIVNELSFDGASGYLIKRQSWVEEWVLRLAKKNAGKWKRGVHEIWAIDGKVGRLYSPLLHSPSPTFQIFIGKLDKYSSLHALENMKEGKKVNLFKIVVFPGLKFFYYFFVKRGYRVGAKGFIYSVLMAFHSYLSWSKQWELSKK